MRLVPEILALWEEARAAFRQTRTWQRARRLGLSQLACLERHTVTGLLCTSGRQFDDWSADYRFFSRDRWQLTQLFRPIVCGGLQLLPAESAIVLALDDTLLRKSGKKTPGVAYRRDPLSPPFQANLILAQRFLQFSMLIPQACASPTGARAVPCRFEHVPSLKKPMRNASAEEWSVYREAAKQQNLNTAACTLLAQLRDELDLVHQSSHRRLMLVADGSYSNKTVIGNLPRNTTFIGRIRKDAKLYFGQAHQPRRYGPPAPTPEALRQDVDYPWQEIAAYAAGKTHVFRVKVLTPIRWRTTGTNRALQVVVIAPVGYRLRQGARMLYRQPAYLICTDPTLSAQELVQDYLWRWDIEVNHRDEKQIIGVGEAQVRSPESVDRQPAFAVATYAMLLLAAIRAFGPDELNGLLPLPKWQRKCPRHRLSTQRLIQHLRYEVWEQAFERMTAMEDRNDFATSPPPDTKSTELMLAPTPPLIYARTG